ncbi:ribbon-helix-helix domain-containing protein [Nocardia carnea]|uniref:Ribbon-helix-helix domain-containing protein n=1 Tax=Nocardia carnea TaxID=37328 RepID=A0ABW7TTH1_9NOCA
MHKTRVCPPAELLIRLDQEAAATGVSRTELVRRGVSMLLEKPPGDAPTGTGERRSARALTH